MRRLKAFLPSRRSDISSIRVASIPDAAEVREALDRLLREVRDEVADDLYARVVSIQASIFATLEAEATAGDATDPNIFVIRQTALAYLPDAFATYLRMPRPVAERRVIADGRTPHDVLLDQLDLMDRRLMDVVDDLARHDSDRLLANGRFLAAKFAISSLHLDPGAPATAAAGTRPATSEASVDDRAIPPPAVAGPRRLIRQRLELRAPPARVFRAWADPEELARWLPYRVEGGLAVGARTVLAWPDRRVWWDVTEAEPNRHFAFWRSWPQSDPLVTKVKVTINPAGTGSRVELEDGPFPLDQLASIDAWAEAIITWSEALAMLRAHLDFSVDLRS